MKKIILILIVLLAFFLRFYKLTSVPALNADEAAIGYNAYSLLLTGKDEHGNSWPINFQSFNDYKPGLYVYIVLPFVKLFGLNEFSVRAPAAFIGVMNILLLYILLREVTKEKANNFTKEYLPLIGALFLAISPWHLQFSRGGWEVTVATFLVTLGVLLFIKGIRNPKLFILSVISFVLSLYTYQSTRVISPLLGLGLIIIYGKEFFKNKKYFLTAFITGFILCIPLLVNLLTPGGFSRAGGVSIFSDVGPINRINQQRGEYQNPNNSFAKALHNKFVNYGLDFFENWGKHYWGEFLFLSGDDIQRNKVPETGQMYIYDFFLIIIALIVLAKKDSEIFTDKRHLRFILLWLFLAPIPAALTFQSPHALRSENMVIPLTILSSIGMLALVEIFNKYKYSAYRFILYTLSFMIVSLSFARYLHMYYVHMQKEYPFSSQYGVQELIMYLNSESKRYKNVVVTTVYDQPYILFLFYLKYPPQEFQGNHSLTAKDNFGFSTVPHFDKYYFQKIDFQKDKEQFPNSLIIGTSDEIPKEANIVKNIYGSNGYLYFRVVAN